MFFSYDSAGRLGTIRDLSQRTLTFNYAGNPTRMSSITDGTGRSVAFTYANSYSPEGDLVSVTDPDGKVWSYEYDDEHKLLTTIEPTSAGPRTVVQNTYQNNYGGTYPSGKVTEQRSEGDNNKLWKIYVAGRQSVEVNPAQGRTIYSYDEKNRIIARKDSNGNISRNLYDGQNHVIQQITPKGEITTSEYDGNNNLTKIIDPMLREKTFAYDSKLRLQQETDFRGKVTTYEYLGPFDSDPLSKVIRPAINNDSGLPNTTLYEYFSPHLLKSVTGPGGNKTSYTYDVYGQLNKRTYHNEDFEEFVNNARGDVVTHKDAERGTETHFEYNNRRQLTKTTIVPDAGIPANNITTEQIYDDAGNLWKTIDPKGNVTINTYSPTQKQLTQTLPPVAAGTPTIVNSYDSRDWLQTSANPLNEITANTYDARGLVVSVTDPLLRTVEMEYNENGKQTAVRTPLAQNQTTTYAYNAKGEQVSMTDASGHAIAYTFDENGNPLTTVNRNNGIFGNTYYGDGSLWASSTPSGKTTTRTYNNRGLLATVAEPSLQQTTMTYDDRGRPLTKVDSVGSSTYSDDKNNNLLTHVENGKTITRVYDELNRLTSYTDENGNVIGYQYDKNNNLTRLTYPGGTKYVDYAYDNLNQLVTLTDWANRITSFTYDLAGRPKSITRPNGTVREITHDAAGQTTEIRELGPDGMPLAVFKLEYDEAGRIENEIMLPPLHPFTEAAQTIDHDADNRISTFNGLQVTHDADGNMTTGPLNGSSLVSFSYDARNRLLSVPAAGGAPFSVYTYDSEGNRTAVTEGNPNGQTTTYAVNPSPALSQVLVRTRPGGSKTYYVYGGGLLYEVDDAGATLTYHYDYRGSTVAVTGGSGQVIERMEYSPYGRLTYRTGNTDTPFLYNGRYGVQTDANGLCNMRARYYNPYIRRFLNADPAGMSGGMNWYAYADGNPISMIDPFGLSAVGDYLFDVGQVYVGYGHAVADTAVGLYNVVRHPVDTSVGLYNVATHPVQAYNAISQGLADTWNSGLEGQGRILGHVLITAATFGATKATSVAGRSSELVEVTRWGRPGLEAGDWVMEGGRTPLNYRLSGKWQNGFGNEFAPIESGGTFPVARGSLYRPQGLNPIDGRLKSLVPGQRRYYPDGAGLLTLGEAGAITFGRAAGNK